MYLHQQDRDEAIKYLANKYPACFFEKREFRRPLKHNILNDLDKEGVLEHSQLVHVLDYYQHDFTYCYGVIAGVDRVGLDGKRAGTVTPQEQREAQLYVTTRKKELAEQRSAQAKAAFVTAVKPPATVNQMNGHTTPMAAKPATPNSPSAVEPIRALLAAAEELTNNAALPEALRPVLVVVALRQVMSETERLVSSLQEKGTRP